MTANKANTQTHIPTAIERVVHYVINTQYNSLNEATILAAKTFILDSIGVGLSGSRIAQVQQVKQAASHWGDAKQAQVWATGEWLPAASAAIVNGYQIHNQEWDCVHEPAVVHPMAVILSALMAYGQLHKVSGKQLLLGVIIGVDVATLIGQSATSGLKFFRPSVCGCLGATAGICAMLSLSKQTTENALGIAYSQLSGTMQAHIEGSPMLAMQIGFNSQAAIRAIDLAQTGFEGPKNILEGPFGYFSLFEDTFDLSPLFSKLGNEFQIEQVSHKPFPTGRAGHGTADGLLTLLHEHNFSLDQIDHITVEATPLINRLVGRPVKNDMTASYAKLCNGYIAATALLTGNITVEDFELEKLRDPERLALAKKVVTRLNDCANPNALAPVCVSVTLKCGIVHSIDLPHILGNPLKPLNRKAQLIKFEAACKSAIVSFCDDQITELTNLIDEIDGIEDIGELIHKLSKN
jgi:aconitate decarboxylase